MASPTKLKFAFCLFANSSKVKEPFFKILAPLPLGCFGRPRVNQANI